MKTDRLEVSIVVCTYNRAAFLKSCLDSLLNQDSKKFRFEVVVVDNNSTDETYCVAQDFASRHGNIRYIVEHRQGTSFARNRGYEEARADWIAYLDDDTRVHENYLDRLLHVIRNYPFDGFGGIYLPWYKYGRPKWFKDHYESNAGQVKETAEIGDHHFVSSGNCAFKKAALQEVGGFPCHLGPRGGSYAYGEETLLQTRMRKKGKKIGFDPHLRVDHAVMRHKMKVEWFFRSAFLHGRDSWLIFDRRPSWPGILRAGASLLGTPVFYFPGFFLRLLDADYYFQNFCIDLLCPAFGAMGKIVGGLGRRSRIK